MTPLEALATITVVGVALVGLAAAMASLLLTAALAHRTRQAVEALAHVAAEHVAAITELQDHVFNMDDPPDTGEWLDDDDPEVDEQFDQIMFREFRPDGRWGQ